MEDLYFANQREFNSFLKSATKFDNQGKEGTTYKKEDLVIKDFGPKPQIDTEHVLQFRDLELKDLFFPQAGIYVRKKLRACITNYAPGLSLEERDIFLQEVKTVLAAIKRLEDVIKESSKAKIRMKDINVGNVLFDSDHFNIIDTNFCYYSPLDYEDIFKLNTEHIMRNIYMKILPKTLYDFQMHYKGENAMYNFPHECLEELSYYLERLLGQFQSFGEAEKTIEGQKILLI